MSEQTEDKQATQENSASACGDWEARWKSAERDAITARKLRDRAMEDLRLSEKRVSALGGTVRAQLRDLAQLSALYAAACRGLADMVAPKETGED